MTSAASEAPHLSPWLTVWFRPGATIERIAAANPRRHVLLLAALSTVSSYIVNLIGTGLTIELLEWRFIAGLVVVGAAIGVVNLYVSGMVFTWVGKVFGGRAPSVSVRAALAWGMAPAVVALLICMAALIGVKLLTDADTSQSMLPTLTIVLQVFGGALTLWALIAILFMLKRLQGFGLWRAIAYSLLASVLLLLIPTSIRTFLFQPFNIPSGAFKPTILVGDYVFVSKFSYGYTRFSLPFSPPLFSGRIFVSEPQRGDVVVFRLPTDDSTDYIKRVIGLPGDRVQMIDGLLHINGEPVKRERIDDYIETEEGSRPARAKRWRETLPNGVSYETLDLVEKGFLDNTQEYVVPAGHYFMMGDNRDNSTDSRVLRQVGYVPFENLIGRAQIIYFSVDRNSEKRALTIRFDRIGTAVR